MKKFFREFKEFALKGNVVDLAVGVIIGAAFKDIVNSLVADIITPFIAGIASLFFKGDIMEFRGFVISLGSEKIAYGAFFSAVLNFLFMALIIFLFVKMINKLKTLAASGKLNEQAVARKCPFCKSKIADDATRCPHCTSILTEHQSA